MHMRRILLTYSLSILTASVAFADYQSINKQESSDRLEQLSQTLAQGSYSAADDMTLPDLSTATTQLREKTAQLNQAMLEQTMKTTANTSQAQPVAFSTTNTGYAWLVNAPLDKGRVSSGWGNRTLLGSTRHHSGLDLAAPAGTSIYATGPGIVTKSGWGTGYGQYVEIDHGNGYVTRYAHASRLLVKAGEHVVAGDHIANVGCTGRCTGPHLHFEVVKDGQRKNPSPYLALLP